jgi:SAM-dependent methyltransferase
MEVKDLLDRMRCPRCASEALERTDAAAVCASCGTSLPIEGNNVSGAAGKVLSDEWEEMQAGSVERYKDEHYEEDETIAKIFGGFIAVTLRPDDVIFDVGCGLFPSMPAYARDLRHGGFVGLEPLTTPVERDYVCMTGAVAEKLPLKDATFDAILLATSLDHIEHVDQAMAELKRILKPGGRIYFWCGLNEPEAMARAKSFHSIFFVTKGAKRALRIAAAPAEYAYFMYRMRKRRRDLAKGVALDTAHFRYYTRESLLKEMADNRLEVRRELLVPGNNSMLVEAVPA